MRASVLRGVGINCTGWGCVVYVDSLLDGARCKCEMSGPLSELRKRRHHGKPSAERTCKALATFKKAQKRQRMSE